MDIFNDDFQDLVLAFNQFDVRYLVVGGYAVNAHGYSRPTGDLDVWVEPTEQNYRCLSRALGHSGLPADAIGLEQFLTPAKYDVFQFGKPPIAIELMKAVKGLTFEKAFKESVEMVISGVPTKLLSYNSLIEAKRAANRLRDKEDINKLKKLKKP